MKLSDNLNNGSWRERWTQWRNALLSSAQFQRWAVRVPLVRGIARRRARALFDLVAGFTYTQTLDAFVRSGAFLALCDKVVSCPDLARSSALSESAMERLLVAAASLDLAQHLGGDRWTLGAAGAALRGNPGLIEMILHHDTLYADLVDPLALLRRGGGGGAVSAHWRYAESPGCGDASEIAAYSRLMAATQPMVAQQALAAYDFSRHRRLLDVGGGEGAFLAAIEHAHPRLALGLFDLPAVVAKAKDVLPDATAERVTFTPGNFLSDPIPSGSDLVTLVRVLHDHDDDVAAGLLRSISDASSPGDSLLIVEPMAGIAGAEPVGGAYFGFYLLAMGSGRARTAAEIRAMLAAAGFARSRLLPTPLPLVASAILATR